MSAALCAGPATLDATGIESAEQGREAGTGLMDPTEACEFEIDGHGCVVAATCDAAGFVGQTFKLPLCTLYDSVHYVQGSHERCTLRDQMSKASQQSRAAGQAADRLV